MMEATDYVSYQTALALKKCGFNEPCDSYYSGNGSIAVREDPECFNCAKDLPICSRPTLWHAQKWLREEKGQIVCVDYSCTATRGAYCHTLTDRETGGTLLVINLTPMNPLSPQVSNKH